MAKLFKQSRQLAAIAAQDAKIIFHEAPFIQFEQFRVNNNFRQHNDLEKGPTNGV